MAATVCRLLGDGVRRGTVSHVLAGAHSPVAATLRPGSDTSPTSRPTSHGSSSSSNNRSSSSSSSSSALPVELLARVAVAAAVALLDEALGFLGHVEAAAATWASVAAWSEARYVMTLFPFYARTALRSAAARAGGPGPHARSPSARPDRAATAADLLRHRQFACARLPVLQGQLLGQIGALLRLVLDGPVSLSGAGPAVANGPVVAAASAQPVPIRCATVSSLRRRVARLPAGCLSRVPPCSRADLDAWVASVVDVLNFEDAGPHENFLSAANNRWRPGNTLTYSPVGCSLTCWRPCGPWSCANWSPRRGRSGTGYRWLR